MVVKGKKVPGVWLKYMNACLASMRPGFKPQYCQEKENNSMRS
jgi:hypothetical protein